MTHMKVSEENGGLLSVNNHLGGWYCEASC